MQIFFTGTETALDILRKTPLVTVDGQNNITVNGQTSFKVLLNGRETSMFARNVSEVLKGFPGKLITRIEVITNPSAKYDAEGIGGLINIITKKKVAEYNGTLRTTASNTKFFSNNLSLNLKYGRWGMRAIWVVAEVLTRKLLHRKSLRFFGPPHSIKGSQTVMVQIAICLRTETWN